MTLHRSLNHFLPTRMAAAACLGSYGHRPFPSSSLLVSSLNTVSCKEQVIHQPVSCHSPPQLVTAPFFRLLFAVFPVYCITILVASLLHINATHNVIQMSVSPSTQARSIAYVSTTMATHIGTLSHMQEAADWVKRSRTTGEQVSAVI